METVNWFKGLYRLENRRPDINWIAKNADN